MMTVQTMPRAHPELANAKGIASRPEPSDALIRFANDLISLKYSNIN